MRASAAEIQCFLASLPEDRVGEFASMPDLPERLAEVWARVQDAWPSFATQGEEFLSYAAERVCGDRSPQAALEEFDAPGLYLACACVAQEALAQRAFSELLAPYARSIALRMGLAVSDTDDLVATLNEQLLVGDGQREPRIVQYQGRGSLRAWLKVCITRIAIRRSQKHQKQRTLPEEAQLLPEKSADDLVLAYLRRQYRQPFTAAFREAFENLSSEDRLLMRRKYVDGLSGDELATLQQVHRATIVRKLARARQQLVDEIRSRLIQRLQVGDDEVDSIIRVLRSQLDASFGSLLGVG